MKDHEFREAVNEAVRLCKVYGQTDQLRAHIAIFLANFKEEVENQ